MTVCNQTQRSTLFSTVLLLTALLLTVGCGKSTEASTEATKLATKSVTETPTISTISVEVRDVSAVVQATGGFEAQESSNVAPNSPGVVTETPVNVGSFVQMDQIIAHLDDRDAKLRLAQAQANQQQAQAFVRQAQSKIGLTQNQTFDPNTVPEVLSARANYESAQAQAKLAQADAQRYENLVNSGDVSRSAYDKAKTAVDTAQAQANASRQQYEATLNNARQNYQGVATQEASLEGIRSQVALAQKALADTQIRAPFAGYVSARPVAAGEYVATSATIATILRITPIKLELHVPETYTSSIKLGLTVEASVSGYPNRVFKGRVSALNPAVETNSRTFTAEVAFPNTDLALKPGMFGTARVGLSGTSKGIYVPRKAVLTDATTNSSQVFMILEGKARLAVVQLGETDGDKVRIISGIPEDAVLATDHLADLYDGQTVNVSKTAGAIDSEVGALPHA
ncbi:MAG: efflux RND transporter periplasmic adaptor subunit [Acidobacteriota bacterium]